jgi:PAS domain S-box-containing protein
MDSWLAVAAVSILVNGVFAWRWRNRDRLLSRLGREATVRGDRQRADSEALLQARAGLEKLKREAQLELQRSEMRYRALADSSPVGIWHVLPDGRTLYLNSAMSEILELDAPGELIGTGQTFHSFFSPESAEIIRRENARRKIGERSHYEVEVRGRYGRRTRMIVYGAPIMDDDGNLESIVGTFVDITERKREEEALRRSEERMRVAAECGTDLIYEWDMLSGVLEWFGPSTSGWDTSTARSSAAWMVGNLCCTPRIAPACWTPSRGIKGRACLSSRNTAYAAKTVPGGYGAIRVPPSGTRTAWP